MLELFTKRPVFQGTDEIHQVEVIFKLLGAPTSERWADVSSLPWFELVRPQHETPNRFREAFSKYVGSY
jgi:CTD kinase subunit alpha